ncbi:DsbA family protein [Nocardiopsis changdeensis]|uniref:Thioredoxin domain-containing protein n=1 Tax=Nocardiopsis changdeensis TaxID=2831969 RepID=A0ABX8BG58_9ACTN|nr:MULTISPECIES: thioredoxin domain-containing protein [Nocardiopsis]QUX21227.1 thioredoxin domain-containing protein [Nocardiopsis changdeensis]QYX37158.1 DsbA family protein [Nocardiopsis sp. MT53]
MGSEARKRARERLKEQRAKEKKAAARRKNLIVIGVAAAVIVLIVGIGYAVLNSDRDEGYTGPLATQTLQEDGSVVMANEGVEAPVVEIYADYQCPACRQFELTNGSLLKERAAQGEAIVHFRPVSIFAQQQVPISSNSLRGGAAARIAADHGVFVEYNDLLFENQPTEGREGFSTDQLEQWFAELETSPEQQQEFGARLEEEAAVVTEFTEEFLPALTEDAVREIGQETLGTMVLSDLLAWGADNGHDPAFLDGTYTGELIDATGSAYTRYSGDNAFRGTPSVYLNGVLLDNNTAMTVRGLSEAIASADPGKVETQPLDNGGDAQ